MYQFVSALSKMKEVPKKGLTASRAEVTANKHTEPKVQFIIDEEPDTRLDGITMVDLVIALKIINKKIEKPQVMRIKTNSISPTIPAKPNYFDSGKIYSVISDTSHIVSNTFVLLIYSEVDLETAGGTLQLIAGTVTIHEYPTIFPPDSIVSLTSVSQFSRERSSTYIF